MASIILSDSWIVSANYLVKAFLDSGPHRGVHELAFLYIARIWQFVLASSWHAMVDRLEPLFIVVKWSLVTTVFGRIDCLFDVWLILSHTGRNQLSSIDHQIVPLLGPECKLFLGQLLILLLLLLVD